MIKSSSFADSLREHKKEIEKKQLKDLFRGDIDRGNRFITKLDLDINNRDFICFDYSKNLITEETIKLLIKLAEASQVKEAIEKMFNGDKINVTENRAAWHIALRAREPIDPVKEELIKMKKISDAIRSGEWKGQNSDVIEDVVNIGIGGSDLGPAVAAEALIDEVSAPCRVHFVSNVDGYHLDRILSRCKNASSTLFIVVSKTFTTRETMLNAQSAKQWLIDNGITEMGKHFIAVSTNDKAIKDFGVTESVKFWDWVGGRYSLWSAVGLSIMIGIGSDQFSEMLAGANAVDEHFFSNRDQLHKNIPALMALIGLWYRNFFKAQTLAVIPFEQALSRFPAYLQQLDMESNGKSTNVKTMQVVDYETGPIIWGEPGTNGQHAFFQHLHQGTDLVPIDFLVGVNGKSLSFIIKTGEEHHRVLFANCIAQSEALMQGRENAKEAFKIFPGNKPSNTLVYRQINPRTLGALVALYEHKVYIQGVILGINSFDQWGVELGKQLATIIEKELIDSSHDLSSHDSSTNNLINFYLSNREN
jgi:glucose-6-phosphate isomerase